MKDRGSLRILAREANWQGRQLWVEIGWQRRMFIWFACVGILILSRSFSQLCLSRIELTQWEDRYEQIEEINNSFSSSSFTRICVSSPSRISFTRFRPRIASILVISALSRSEKKHEEKAQTSLPPFFIFTPNVDTRSNTRLAAFSRSCTMNV